MRHRPRRRGVVAEPDPLLRLRLPVRDLRRRVGVPVPVGQGVPVARVPRGGRDDDLHRDLGRWAPVRLAQGSPQVGVITEKTPLPKVKPVKFILNWGRRYSLWVFNFGLACCSIELLLASAAND